MGTVDGRVVEEGLLDPVLVFAILGVEVFDGLGVSFKDLEVSFVVLGVVLEVTFGVVVEPAFGVVGVSGAFNLLPDRAVTAGALCNGSLFGVPVTLPNNLVLFYKHGVLTCGVWTNIVTGFCQFIS